MGKVFFFHFLLAVFCFNCRTIENANCNLFLKSSRQKGGSF